MSRILETESLHLDGVSLRQRLYEVFTSNSESIFIKEVKSGKNFTYEKIWEMSRNFAQYLKDIGLQEGDVVTVCADSNLIETYVVILGVWFSGITMSPINPGSTVREITRFLQVTRSTAVYCDDKYLEKVIKASANLDNNIIFIATNGQKPIINYYDCIQNSEESLKFIIEEKDKDNHILSVMFTSGTSGEPKGVELRSEAFKYTLSSFPLNGGKSFMLTTAIFWISNPFYFLKTLLSCGTIIIPDSTVAQDVLQVITDYKPDMMMTGCTLLMSLGQVYSEKYNTSSLNKVYFGGSHVLVEHKRAVMRKVFGGRNVLVTLYGATEAGIITCFECKDADINTPRYQSVGNLLRGYKAKIIDIHTKEILEPFKQGEICVKSPCTMRKYSQKIPSEDELDSDGWWHMGDMGYYDEEGYIYFVSRLKEIFRCRGFLIAPAELEEIIHQHPDVIECCVVGKPDDIDGEVAAAFVVKRRSSSLSENELYDLVSREVIDAKNLRGGIFFVNSLPKSPVGKPLRKELLKMFTS